VPGVQSGAQARARFCEDVQVKTSTSAAEEHVWLGHANGVDAGQSYQPFPQVLSLLVFIAESVLSATDPEYLFADR